MTMTRALDLAIATWELREKRSFLDRALSILRSGGVVAAPTDTVYGLLARASSGQAIDAIFALKSRPRDVSLPVLVRESAQAVDACGIVRGESRDRMEQLAKRFWPGPLTVVVDARANSITTQVSDGCSIAVRAPDGELLRPLLGEEPIVGTSANLHGQVPGCNGQEVVDGLRGIDDRSLEDLYELGLRLVLDGHPGGSQSSTVIDLRGASPSVLRQGPISEFEILDALGHSSLRRS